LGLSMIEMTLEREVARFVQEAVRTCNLLDFWLYDIDRGMSTVRILALSEEVEAIMDILEKNYGSLQEFRIIVLPVEATLPRLLTTDRILADLKGRVFELRKQAGPKRMSREALYVSVVDSTSLSASFLALAILSSVVASIGLLRDNVAIVIGSMVIAPLLGPNIAFAFGAAIGDLQLLKSSLKAQALATVGILLVAVSIGYLFVTPEWVTGSGGEVTVNLGDVGLALAAGIAGALSFTSGFSASLVGVMVAVAVVPPLVHTGLLLGAGYVSAARITALIYCTNIICINLSSMMTFLVQRIGPGYLDSSTTARKAAIIMLIVWMLFLMGVVIAILGLNPVRFPSL
jgi:uncharacterized hydrophobic protein (TIGR00341 family)